jgi:putative phosphoesterase
VKIAVLSDTHVNSLDQLAKPIVEALSKVDIIVHAGDFTHMKVLDDLRKLGTVKVVWGNMDPDDIKAALEEKLEFTAGGKKIGLTHGSKGPEGIAERVRKMFGAMDIIIFGHSHLPYDGIVEGSLMFNPGPARQSFGLIIINKEIKTEIIKI